MRCKELATVAGLLVVSGCDGSTAPTTPGAAANAPPTVSISSNPAGQAIVGVTTLTFTATGSDPNGDTLTYTWDVGEGVTGTGTTVSRLYKNEGSFPVSLTASDGRGGTTTARATAVVRSLSGAWTPLINGVRQDPAALTQEGSTLYGAVDSGCCKHTFAGEIAHPRSVTLEFRFSACKKRDLTFTGTVSAGLDRIETTGPNCNVPQTRFEFVRP